MNPFEKRDKIPRTPPGMSFHERSFCNLNVTVHADCSLYDDSGVRVLQTPVDLKRYTLTFEDNKNNDPISSGFRISFCEAGLSTRPVFPLRPSITQNMELCTSSPLCKVSLPTQSKSPVQNVSNQPRSKENVHSTVGRNATPSDKLISGLGAEFIEPELINSPAPITIRRLRPRTRTQTNNIRLPTKRRGNRTHVDPHDCNTLESSVNDGQISVASSSSKGNNSSGNAAKQTRSMSRRKRRVSSPKTSSTPQPETASGGAVSDACLTPTTVVAKPRARGRRRQNVYLSETPPVAPVTVRRRVTAPTHSIDDQSVISTNTDVASEVISRTVRRRGTAALPSCSVRKMSHLDAMSVTPTLIGKGRRAEKLSVSTTVLSQDEPVSSRLRVRCAQLSYVDSSVSSCSRR